MSQSYNKIESGGGLPIGSPEKVKSKETLPAVEVANEVIWVNSDFPELPFDLKRGKATNLGLFLTPEEAEKKFPLEPSFFHGRSALLGRIIMKDKKGNLYRDLDLKGMGWVQYYGKQIEEFNVGPLKSKGTEESWGIFNESEASEAASLAEKFARLGVRTERYLAIIRLKEVVDESGHKISIEKARAQGKIPTGEGPVIGLRAYGIKKRIVEISTGPKNAGAGEDARRMVAQELKIDEKKFSLEDYFEWFAKTLGKNLGLIHKNGWSHGNLTAHNVTLDCRIVDFDLAKRIEQPSKPDWLDAKLSVETLVNHLGEGNLEELLQREEKLGKIYNQAYVEALGYKPDFIKE